MGKLIVVDGVDSSGKETQVKRLYERLKEEGYNVTRISFPDYESPSSSLVKMYLNGDFGGNAGDVDSYVASTFYAVDRYASFNTKWGSIYNGNGIIIADRYTTSNMVHQASKIHDLNEKDEFLEWLHNLEYGLYKLPIPDAVIFLDMPPEEAIRLMEKRKNKFSGEEEKDIHENDKEYLIDSYNNAHYVADKFGWAKVKCVKANELRTIEDISSEVFEIAKKIIEEL